MQLTLALIDPPPPPPSPWDQLDPEARAAALASLARLIAQALARSQRTEPVDE